MKESREKKEKERKRDCIVQPHEINPGCLGYFHISEYLHRPINSD